MVGAVPLHENGLEVAPVGLKSMGRIYTCLRQRGFVQVYGLNVYCLTTLYPATTITR